MQDVLFRPNPSDEAVACLKMVISAHQPGNHFGFQMAAVLRSPYKHEAGPRKPTRSPLSRYSTGQLLVPFANALLTCFLSTCLPAQGEREHALYYWAMIECGCHVRQLLDLESTSICPLYHTSTKLSSPSAPLIYLQPLRQLQSTSMKGSPNEKSSTSTSTCSRRTQRKPHIEGATLFHNFRHFDITC